MENPKQQLIDRLKATNNILVTVSNSPSVDQLAAAIGLTVMLNKLNKHATAVFSGAVPATIDFLQPEKTIEKNTDSLRDFIIALDKAKADKLRYKVEDSHVKIFITPYRTSISDKDLVFSQGDFNVETVVALGVKDQKDLDRAITAHGRILHDATTFSVTNGVSSTVGSVDWDDPSASSLCEMTASLAGELGKGLLDEQIATAFMTGIVAETERFRNAKTSAATMTIGAELMSAGANQQLVASQLEAPEDDGESKSDDDKPHDEDKKREDAPAEGSDNGENNDQAPEEEVIEEKQDGALQIDHDEPRIEEAVAALDLPQPAFTDDITEKDTESNEDPVLPMASDVHDALPSEGLPSEPAESPLETEELKPEETAVELPPETNEFTTEEATQDAVVPTSLPPLDEPQQPLAPQTQTLSELEARVQEAAAPASDVQADALAQVDTARNAVLDALSSNNGPLPPISALGAQPLDMNVQDTPPVPSIQVPEMPAELVPPAAPVEDTTAAPVDPSAPPAVPPPFMPGPMPMMPPMPPMAPPAPPAAPENTDNTSGQAHNPFGLPPA